MSYVNSLTRTIMGRSRSRSPLRKEKRRSRSRERDRDRERRRRHRSRSRSPRNHRSHSHSPHRGRSSSPHHRSGSRDNDVVFIGTSKGPVPGRPGGPNTSRSRRRQTADDSVVTIDDDTSEASMMRMMGFSDFNSTKGKHVAGNDIYAANIVQKRKYRQYMNRRGGFNRPLDFVA